MKTVFNNDMVAHVWAAQSQSEGRSSNGNFYFRDSVIYSYGSHFPIAKMHNGIVLFNADSYSPSTQRHQSYARHAVTHLESVSLPELDSVLHIMAHKSDNALRAYIKRLSERIESIRDKMSRMRAAWKKQSAQGEIDSLCHAARFVWSDLAGRRGDPFTATSRELKKEKRAADIRKLERIRDAIEQSATLDINAAIEKANATRPDFDAEYYERVRWIEAVRRAQIEAFNGGLDPFQIKAAPRLMGNAWLSQTMAIESERGARNMPIETYARNAELWFKSSNDAMNQEKLTRWLAGESDILRGTLGSVPMILRIKGDELQTSRGASVPLDHAIKLTSVAMYCRKAGKGWVRNGQQHRVGHFSTDKISSEGDLTVGCHLIKWRAIADCVARFSDLLPDDLVQSVVTA